MPKITYHHPNGEAETVEATTGTSVMRTALINSVDGIVGECGGQLMCATCHVYVHDTNGLPEVSEDEDEMLDATTEDRLDNSRLSCQLIGGRDFEELAVDVPKTQN